MDNTFRIAGWRFAKITGCSYTCVIVCNDVNACVFCVLSYGSTIMLPASGLSDEIAI